MSDGSFERIQSKAREKILADFNEQSWQLTPWSEMADRSQPFWSKAPRGGDMPPLAAAQALAIMGWMQWFSVRESEFNDFETLEEREKWYDHMNAPEWLRLGIEEQYANQRSDDA